MRNFVPKFKELSHFMMKKLLFFTLTLGMLTITAYSCKLNGEGQPQGQPTDTIAPEPEEYHLSLLIAGDLMQHEPQIKAALRPDGSYNYDECFARVKPEIERADVAIANFEVTLGGRPYKGYPQFSAPDEYLQACVDAGFDILFTANNHCLDRGQQGLERTLTVLDSFDVPHLGTYRDEAERERSSVL